jgi:hypothetical protein
MSCVRSPRSSSRCGCRPRWTNVGRRAGQAPAGGDPPYGAKVHFELEKATSGWNAPALAPWLEASVDGASREFFRAPPAYNGEGGSIPFMGMLGEKFPGAQFLITGVLGPQSNAHGPNEFLHIPTGKRVSMCVAKVIADHHQASRAGPDQRRCRQCRAHSPRRRLVAEMAALEGAIRIRPARSDDAAALADLSTQLGYPALADTLSQRLARVRGGWRR